MPDSNLAPFSFADNDRVFLIDPTHRLDRVVYDLRSVDCARWARNGPRAADNIAAWHTGSESDTVNPLTRLPMYFYSEPSRIIVATLPGSPWHSYHQKYRVGKPARAKACPLAAARALPTRPLSRELLSSVKLLNRTFFSLRVKSDS